MRRMLTQDEEDDLVTWLREHTFLYDKSSADFKMSEKKAGHGGKRRSNWT